MVSSVQPLPYAAPNPAANANRPVGADANARPAPQVDRMDAGQSYRGDIATAQATLTDARGKLDLALAAGREGAGILSQLRDVARAAANGDAATSAASAASGDTFKALLQKYDQVVSGAVDGGAGILAGQSLTLTVDPDAAPIDVQGYDMRLKAQPGAEDVLRLSSDANIGDAASAASAARDSEASLARMDTALGRLSAAAQKLGSHASFLSALDSSVANAVSPDLDAEGARLTALQVRQSLAGANGAIANSSPSGLLGLFRE
jgi:flagellin